MELMWLLDADGFVQTVYRMPPIWLQNGRSCEDQVNEVRRIANSHININQEIQTHQGTYETETKQLISASVSQTWIRSRRSHEDESGMANYCRPNLFIVPPAPSFLFRRRKIHNCDECLERWKEVLAASVRLGFFAWSGKNEKR